MDNAALVQTVREVADALTKKKGWDVNFEPGRADSVDAAGEELSETSDLSKVTYLRVPLEVYDVRDLSDAMLTSAFRRRVRPWVAWGTDVFLTHGTQCLEVTVLFPRMPRGGWWDVGAKCGDAVFWATCFAFVLSIVLLAVTRVYPGA